MRRERKESNAADIGHSTLAKGVVKRSRHCTDYHIRPLLDTMLQERAILPLCKPLHLSTWLQ